MNTMETNYRNALKDVRKVGIKTRLNVMECCRGCVSNTKLGIENDDVAIIWTYGGQDNATSWHDGLPFSRTELNNLKRNGGWGWRQLERYVNNAENIAFCDLFNHNGLTEQQMQVVYNIFTAHGFVVNWAVEERAYKCIEINYKATYMREQAAVAAQAINTDTYAMC